MVILSSTWNDTHVLLKFLPGGGINNTYPGRLGVRKLPWKASRQGIGPWLGEKGGKLWDARRIEDESVSEGTPVQH